MDYRYGGWAASGEIDIMEGRGERPSDVSGTLHHGGQWPQNVWTTSGDHSIGVDLSKDFHVYTLEWTPNYMKWYIDDVLTQNYDMNRWWNSSAQNVYSAKGQPFDQRFHFILNLAVGGSFFGGAPPVTDAQSAAWASPEMRVDYVRVWQQGGNCASPQPVPTSAPSQAADNNGRPTTSAAVQTSQAPTAGRCNNQAYDQNAYTCTINNNGQQVLCPVGLSSCGQACFSPNNYCCNNGNLLAKGQCPAVQPSTSATRTTTTATPTSSTSTPTPTTPTEAAGFCNGQRYDWNLYDCTVNQAGRKVLCQKGNQSCGESCFNPSLYCCKNGALTQKWQC